MKIVQIVNSITAGGAERLVQDLHREYLRMGHQSCVVSLVGEKQVEGKDGFFCAGCQSPYAPSVSNSLSRLFRNEQLVVADIVHVHLFPALLLVPGTLRSAGWRGRLFATEHSTSNRRRGTMWGSLADNYTYRPYGKIICVSQAVRDSIVEWKPALRNKAVVIPNGARLGIFQPLPRTDFQDPPVILSVGRLTSAKNYSRALKAVADLVDRTDYRFKWLIAGDGGMRSQLTELASQLSLDGIVEFLGTREDIPQLMRDADIFFIPSAWEGFGIAAVEAMASGLPVVAGDVPGLRDIVGKDAGLFVDPASVEEISRALEALLCDSASALRMGLNGPDNAAGYSLEACSQAHLDLFNSSVVDAI